MGRELELARVKAFLGEVGAGGRASLLIEGEPGLGKTALWLHGLASARADGVTTLVVRPVESEAALSFAGLADLLEPALPEVLSHLPEPQRRALEVALLLRPADGPPDRRALATAFLTTLRTLAADSAVIVAVDDLQWLDSASRSVLAFAARRLVSERIGFLLTRRSGEEDSAAVELELALAGRLERFVPAPLSLGALNRLLQEEFGHSFSRPLVRRLRSTSGGNPFFTLELGRALESSGAAPDALRGLSLPATLREVVHARLASLPAEERGLLVVAAALSRPTLDLIAKGAGRSLESASLQHSLASGVVVADGDRLRFTHPLLRSVVYADASVASKRMLHERLAGAIADPEESAWHLALARESPDGRVAARLEEAALIVRGRGAPDRAAELFTRAAELALPGDAHARRCLLAAADCWTDAGDSARAVPLLDTAIATSRSGGERAEALARLGWIRSRNAGYREGRGLFEEAAREGATDPSVQISIEKGLSWADEMLGDLGAAEEHALGAVAFAEAMADSRLLAQSLADLAFIEWLRGRRYFRSTLGRAMLLERSRAGQDPAASARWLDVRTRWFEALILAWSDDLAGSRAALLELHAQADELGDEHVIPQLLNWLGRVDCFAGSWHAGLLSARAAYEAAVQAGLTVERPYSLATIALAHAHLGESDASWAALAEGLEVAQRLEVLPGEFELLAAKGFLELSLGDAGAAFATLVGLSDRAATAGFAQPAAQRFHPDLIEAALDVGELGRAQRCLAELEQSAKELASPWAGAVSARCGGMISAAEGDLDRALFRLEQALFAHDRLPNPFERGRTLLQQGIVLRRLRRKRAARDAIASALAIFSELGARLWAERARSELGRISGASPGSSDELTETESRVAALVAAGRANKQVAAELHITVRTVESNLTRIYRKLGVRSRTELAAKLTSIR